MSKPGKVRGAKRKLIQAIWRECVAYKISPHDNPQVHFYSSKMTLVFITYSCYNTLKINPRRITWL